MIPQKLWDMLVDVQRLLTECEKRPFVFRFWSPYYCLWIQYAFNVDKNCNGYIHNTISNKTFYNQPSLKDGLGIRLMFLEKTGTKYKNKTIDFK